MTRSVAFYLPQFHTIPENDEWWGKGFTEWTNVRRGAPRFEGHDQPHAPGELGYYDLREHDVRMAQASLAKAYGIDAFCYYHYWFDGRRLLNEPFDDTLASRDSDFPFMLCWANEAWTRSWSGKSGVVLVEQRYSHADDVAHIQSLLPAFADPRYVRHEGRPVFVVYRASDLPDPRRTTDTWREEASRAGLGELHLCRVESSAAEQGDPAKLGFDAAVDFRPNWRALRPSVIELGLRRIAHRARLLPSPYRRHIRVAYEQLVADALGAPDPGYTRYPCVVPSWDNSARRDYGAVIVEGSTPDAYERWVRGALAANPAMLFVNAWNEWGEGCHLEPDQRWGRAYLEAHLAAVNHAGAS